MVDDERLHFPVTETFCASPSARPRVLARRSRDELANPERHEMNEDRFTCDRQRNNDRTPDLNRNRSQTVTNTDPRHPRHLSPTVTTPLGGDPDPPRPCPVRHSACRSVRVSRSTPRGRGGDLESLPTGSSLGVKLPIVTECGPADGCRRSATTSASESDGFGIVRAIANMPSRTTTIPL